MQHGCIGKQSRRETVETAWAELRWEETRMQRGWIGNRLAIAWAESFAGRAGGEHAAWTDRKRLGRAPLEGSEHADGQEVH